MERFVAAVAGQRRSRDIWEVLERESFLPKLTLRTTLLLSILLLGSVDFARAQGVSPYVGLGSARDRVGTSAAQGCPAGQLFDGVICQAGPTMGGLFAAVGVDFMFKKHLGINGEYSFHYKRASYLPSDGLSMRPSFYDINALWQPFSGRRVVPFLEGGIGGARVQLYFNQAAATGLTSAPSLPTGMNPTYLQLHGAFGVKVYLYGRLFARPEFDLRYVPRLTNQFGRHLVVQYGGSVGFTFGAH